MDFDTAVARFVDELNARYSANYTVQSGSKFVKVVQNGGSVHSFVARKAGTTKGLGTVCVGDVLKAASWKTPARHARGSVFADSFEGYGVDEYGANYLR